MRVKTSSAQRFQEALKGFGCVRFRNLSTIINTKYSFHGVAHGVFPPAVFFGLSVSAISAPCSPVVIEVFSEGRDNICIWNYVILYIYIYTNKYS